MPSGGVPHQARRQLTGLLGQRGGEAGRREAVAARREPQEWQVLGQGHSVRTKLVLFERLRTEVLWTEISYCLALKLSILFALSLYTF